MTRQPRNASLPARSEPRPDLFSPAGSADPENTTVGSTSATSTRVTFAENVEHEDVGNKTGIDVYDLSDSEEGSVVEEIPRNISQRILPPEFTSQHTDILPVLQGGDYWKILERMAPLWFTNPEDPPADEVSWHSKSADDRAAADALLYGKRRMESMHYRSQREQTKALYALAQLERRRSMIGNFPCSDEEKRNLIDRAEVECQQQVAQSDAAADAVDQTLHALGRRIRRLRRSQAVAPFASLLGPVEPDPSLEEENTQPSAEKRKK
ncbi:hypothetical protein BGZ99_000739 [Dissophora globulifera]|uniref:Uncharacterized protein n=1 Tax=Dissophora globulifera TaxID=979702 RepID=A0A9P6R0K6_9FUNG|nr:hypothetical protein BGZ99_000739 [Dissophora globulifera]